MIDFHCHLDLYPDPKQVVASCYEQGLYVLSVTTTPSAWRGTSALAEGYDRIRTALGLHPQLASQRRSELPLFDELLPTVRYVGEIGLDGSPEFSQSWEIQLQVFEHILESCARLGGRIMSIHSRRASKSVLDLLETRLRAGDAVLHWYSGTYGDLQRAIHMDCWFSVGPAMIRSERGRSLVARMPPSRVLTETDGPFAQDSGRPLLPGETGNVVAFLADLWGTSRDDAETKLEYNLRQLVTSDIR